MDGGDEMSLSRAQYNPARPLRGGIVRAILFREDTGSHVDVKATFLPAAGYGPLEHDPDRVMLASGSNAVRQQSRRLQIMVSDAAAAEVLESWGRVPVKALIVGQGSAPHTLWGEPVPLDTSPAPMPFGQFSGLRVLLETGRYDAEIKVHDNLLALDPWASEDDTGQADGWQLATTGSVTATFAGAGPYGAQGLALGSGATALFWRDYRLPSPGLRVRHLADVLGGEWGSGPGYIINPSGDATGEVVLQALTRAQSLVPMGTAVLAETRVDMEEPGLHEASLVLPADTYTVRVGYALDAGTGTLPTVVIRRPRLVTRSLVPTPTLSGGFILNSSDAWGHTVTPFGDVTQTLTEQTVTFQGTPYTITHVEFGPSGLMDVLLRVPPRITPQNQFTAIMETL